MCREVPPAQRHPILIVADQLAQLPSARAGTALPGLFIQEGFSVSGKTAHVFMIEALELLTRRRTRAQARGPAGR